MMALVPPPLKKGGAIGVVCPSSVADPDRFGRVRHVLESMGFAVKFGDNIYCDSFGFAASTRERADDFNAMLNDPEVGMILFSGGDGACDLLPFIDYGAVMRKPVILCSFSDATSILNTVASRTGVVTYYGPTPGSFEELLHYNWMEFHRHFISPQPPASHTRNSEWKVIRPGECEGELIGGYIDLFLMTLANPSFDAGPPRPRILFLEDHEMFAQPGAVCSKLSFLEQSPFMAQVKGLLFGRYAQVLPEMLEKRLERFGADNGIPVACSEDFGHAGRHAVLPIGVGAKMDAGLQLLRFTGYSRGDARP